MTTVYDVPAEKLITKVSRKLEEIEEIGLPAWAAFVKTGVNRGLPPDNPLWWHTRCASILRRIYMNGPVGISRLRTAYAGTKNNGSKPHHSERGSGSILREALKQLEKAGFIESSKDGRLISPKGQSFLDNTSFEVKTELVKELPALEKY
ncbi:30S ribosomal protein S19e [Methanosarcinales archaeon]|nr:MAG: 30S ribosomal protein S19e [Methanosarcinales archaeon]